MKRLVAGEARRAAAVSTLTAVIGPATGSQPDGEAADPPVMSDAVERAVREAIDTGRSLGETHAQVATLLSHAGHDPSHDDITTWIGSHALGVT
jgi:hypothetical protein